MTVDDNEDIPVYLRLRGMIAAAIIDGRYAEGSQLPSVRAFAAKTQTNPLTVAKAYQSLQDEGHVVVRRGVGMFVAEASAARLKQQERDAFLSKVWPRTKAVIERLEIPLHDLFEEMPV